MQRPVIRGASAGKAAPWVARREKRRLALLLLLLLPLLLLLLLRSPLRLEGKDHWSSA